MYKVTNILFSHDYIPLEFVGYWMYEDKVPIGFSAFAVSEDEEKRILYTVFTSVINPTSSEREFTVFENVLEDEFDVSSATVT